MVVEDGTGEVVGANSYVSLAEFVAYWNNHGYDFTTETTPAIQRSLIKATQYIDLENGNYFKGYPLLDDQPLAFPRTCMYIRRHGGCILVEGVPIEVKIATYEYAKRVLTSETGDLQPDPVDRDETGQVVMYSFEKIGPIETKIDYVVGSGSEVRSYPAADKWLLPLLKYTGGGSIRN
jgi:hypothetical protein